MSNEPRKVRCEHCKGTGEVTISSEAESIETYYFGCIGRSGHFWHSSQILPVKSRESEIEKRVGGRIHPRIDGGFAPGSTREADGSHSYRRDREEKEGEARLTHIAGWTVLSFWDYSVDHRGAANSGFVAHGTHDYMTMRVIAEAQFPNVWKRFTVAIKLVEERKE